ncbi:hypothetical protein [Nocardiopsis tropica]|uniref:Uncharacterized protein n=1 Tax=Nocardiopsis tropica TaxID=109330 RepID=A0ABU7KM24_9ACTN|nr:hypothetical protein [Nocardiopsis umidischolae]MEE2050344.1 hypothetical protein [Nocardiopsis umidischolae]
MTLGDLARGETLHAYEVPGTGHHLVVINLLYADDVPRIERAYQALDHPARPHVWAAMVTPDPWVDPAGYAEARWWATLERLDLDLIRLMESRGHATAWPHGYSAGPLLSPSRA